MHATILYRLSADGQKASLLAGGTGQREQTVTVPSDGPHFAAVVALASIDSDGSVTLDLRYKHDFPAPPTVAELVNLPAMLAERKAAEDSAAIAEAVAAHAAVLAERRVTTTSHGLAHGVVYSTSVPAWPFVSAYGRADGMTAALDAITGSADAVAWTDGLIAANDAAKSAAEQLVAEHTAEKNRKAAIAAQAEAERRAELGMTAADIDLDIEDGALTEVPSNCWESHSRGKNWLAIITPDPSSPGGLARHFAAKAKGASYYIVPDLAVGDAVEFGADYYSGRGRKSPTRWYGFVVRLDGERLILRQCAGGKTACKAGQKYRAEHGDQPVEDAVAAGIARINAEGGIEPSAN